MIDIPEEELKSLKRQLTKVKLESKLRQNLANELERDLSLNGQSFNFGPTSECSKTVKNLLDDLSKYWDLTHNPSSHPNEIPKFHEAGLLKLNCDKALFDLNWQPTLNFKETVKNIFVSDNYKFCTLKYKA